MKNQDFDEKIHEFQQFMREILDEYYPHWEIRYNNFRPDELPYKKTLDGWVGNKPFQHPQDKKINKLLNEGRFPDETNQKLEELYQNLPPRRHTNNATKRNNNLSSESNPQTIIHSQNDINTTTITKNLRHHKNMFIAIVFISLSIIVIGLFSYYNQKREMMWCSENALGTEIINDHYLLYFDSVLPLGNFDEAEFHIYFDEEYISGDILSNRRINLPTNTWNWLISSNWINQHPDWQNLALWRVDYSC
ncbi:MAG: hypothetical protein Phog2KO_22170 [Phototrophicaceae bacterium]